MRGILSLEGPGRLGDCCSAGGMGCCDMLTALQANGYDTSGMGSLGDTASLVQQVQSTLAMTPGASSVVADYGTVAMLEEVLTNATANRLDSELADYKRKVEYLNAALRRIDARRDDLALRTQLLNEHARTAKAVGDYGTALIQQINKYNEMVTEFSGTIAGKIASPNTVPVTGIPKLDVPTGMSGLGFVHIPIALVVLVGIIALLLWKSGSIIQDYMHYDLKTKGFKEGMDREYEGFTGAVQQYIDKAGGNILTTALLIGGGVVAFLILKNYLSKKGVIGSSSAASALPAAIAKPIEAGQQAAAQAVKEVAAVAAKA